MSSGRPYEPQEPEPDEPQPQGSPYVGKGRAFELAVDDAARDAKEKGVAVGTPLQILSTTVILSDSSHISDYIVELG